MTASLQLAVWSPKPPRAGEPELRPLAYHRAGHEHVHDQFLLGEDVLVAPVLEQGAMTRTVVVPSGRWVDVGHTEVSGPTMITVRVGVESLPHRPRIG